MEKITPHIDFKNLVDEVWFKQIETDSSTIAIRSLNIDTSEIKTLIKDQTYNSLLKEQQSDQI